MGLGFGKHITGEIRRGRIGIRERNWFMREQIWHNALYSGRGERKELAFAYLLVVDKDVNLCRSTSSGYCRIHSVVYSSPLIIYFIFFFHIGPLTHGKRYEIYCDSILF